MSLEASRGRTPPTIRFSSLSPPAASPSAPSWSPGAGVGRRRLLCAEMAAADTAPAAAAMDEDQSSNSSSLSSLVAPLLGGAADPSARSAAAGGSGSGSDGDGGALYGGATGPGSADRRSSAPHSAADSGYLSSSHRSPNKSAAANGGAADVLTAADAAAGGHPGSAGGVLLNGGPGPAARPAKAAIPPAIARLRQGWFFCCWRVAACTCAAGRALGQVALTCGRGEVWSGRAWYLIAAQRDRPPQRRPGAADRHIVLLPAMCLPGCGCGPFGGPAAHRNAGARRLRDKRRVRHRVRVRSGRIGPPPSTARQHNRRSCSAARTEPFRQPSRCCPPSMQSCKASSTSSPTHSSPKTAASTPTPSLSTGPQTRRFGRHRQVLGVARLGRSGITF